MRASALLGGDGGSGDKGRHGPTPQAAVGFSLVDLKSNPTKRQRVISLSEAHIAAGEIPVLPTSRTWSFSWRINALTLFC